MIAKRKKPSKAHPKMSRHSKVGFQGNPFVSITPVNFRVYPFVKGTTLKRYVATDGPVDSDIVSVDGELTGEVIPLSLSDR